MAVNGLRVSACSACYGREPLPRVIDRMAELGFDGVELTVMYHLIPEDGPAADLGALRRRLEDAGLRASCLHFIFPGGMSFVSDLGSERERVRRQIVNVAEMTAALEAEVVMVGGGGIRSIPTGLDRTEGTKRVVEVFASAAEEAGRLGVKIAFEALNRYESNVGNGLLEVRQLTDATDNPWLGVGGDTFHMNIEELRLPNAIEAAAPRLFHLHLADSHRLAPGDGHVDFAGVLAALDRTGYNGWLSFELFYIAPGLAHLPTFEACDREVARGLEHVRSLQRGLASAASLA